MARTPSTPVCGGCGSTSCAGIPNPSNCPNKQTYDRHAQPSSDPETERAAQDAEERARRTADDRDQG